MAIAHQPCQAAGGAGASAPGVADLQASLDEQQRTLARVAEEILGGGIHSELEKQKDMWKELLLHQQTQAAALREGLMELRQQRGQLAAVQAEVQQQRVQLRQQSDKDSSRWMPSWEAWKDEQAGALKELRIEVQLLLQAQQVRLQSQAVAGDGHADLKAESIAMLQDWTRKEELQRQEELEELRAEIRKQRRDSGGAQGAGAAGGCGEAEFEQLCLEVRRQGSKLAGVVEQVDRQCVALTDLTDGLRSLNLGARTPSAGSEQLVALQQQVTDEVAKLVAHSRQIGAELHAELQEEMRSELLLHGALSEDRKTRTAASEEAQHTSQVFELRRDLRNDLKVLQDSAQEGLRAEAQRLMEEMNSRVHAGLLEIMAKANGRVDATPFGLSEPEPQAEPGSRPLSVAPGSITFAKAGEGKLVERQSSAGLVAAASLGKLAGRLCSRP